MKCRRVPVLMTRVHLFQNAGVFPVVISRTFALALTIYTVATQLLLYYVRSPRYCC